MYAATLDIVFCETSLKKENLLRFLFPGALSGRYDTLKNLCVLRSPRSHEVAYNGKRLCSTLVTRAADCMALVTPLFCAILFKTSTRFLLPV